MDEADRRGPWVVVATALALASPLAGHGAWGLYDGYPTSAIGTPEMSMALGLLALATLAAVLVIDVVAAEQARRARFAVFTMRPVADGQEPICEDVQDLGLGAEAHEEVADAGSAYRTSGRPVRVILGDAEVSWAALRRASLGTTAALVASVLAVAVAFSGAGDLVR